MRVASRLPAHIEITGLIRAVQNAGGFATVLARGERDSGTILVVCRENGAGSRVFERMPRIDGTRSWDLVKTEDIENKDIFEDYLKRRRSQDSDLWIVEVDIADGERFIR